jgi:ketosteroid isomerase-like protein
VEIEEIHHFTLEDGKIVRYRPFLDTATVLAAYRPD